MGQVRVTVNGRNYDIACDDGEEEHLKSLARFIDKRVADLSRSLGGMAGDAKLLLMTSLLIADELSTALSRIEELQGEQQTLRELQSAATERAQNAETMAASVIEAAARRIEDIAAKLDAA